MTDTARLDSIKRMDNSELCREWLRLKLREHEAKAERKLVEDKLKTTLDNIKLDTPGSFHFVAPGYRIDMRIDSDAEEAKENSYHALWDMLPEIARAFVLIPAYKFSKSGYDTAVKTLGFLAVASPKEREKLEALKRAVAENVVFKPSNPYFTIVPVVREDTDEMPFVEKTIAPEARQSGAA